jgi:hypothetical protein
VSIMNELRGYADAAVEQGKHTVTDILDHAQTRVAELTTKATGAVGELRQRAEVCYAVVKRNQRTAKMVASAEQVADVVVGAVQERVVRPLLILADRDAAPTKPPAKPAPRKAATTRPTAKATTRPAAARTTPRKTTAKKSAPTN